MFASTTFPLERLLRKVAYLFLLKNVYRVKYDTADAISYFVVLYILCVGCISTLSSNSSNFACGPQINLKQKKSKKLLEL